MNKHSKIKIANGDCLFVAKTESVSVVDSAAKRRMTLFYFATVAAFLLVAGIIFAVGFFAVLKALIDDNFSWLMPGFIAGFIFVLYLIMKFLYYTQVLCFGFQYSIEAKGLKGRWGLIPIRVCFSSIPEVIVTLSQRWHGSWWIGIRLRTNKGIIRNVPLCPAYSVAIKNDTDFEYINAEIKKIETFFVEYCPFLAVKLNLNPLAWQDKHHYKAKTKTKVVKKKNIVVALVIWLIFCIIGGGIFFFEAGYPLIKYYQSQSWQVVNCDITSIEIDKETNSKGKITYKINLIYQYEINGKTYTSRRYNFFNNRESKDKAYQVFNELQTARTQRAIVNPLNYTDAVLNPSITRLTASWLLLVPVVIFLCGLGGIISVTTSALKCKKLE